MSLKIFKNVLSSIGLFILYLFITAIFHLENNPILGQIIASIITILIISYIYKDIIIKNIKNIRKDFNLKLFIKGLLLIVLGILISEVLRFILGHDSSNNIAVINKIKTYKLLYTFSIIFITPLVEEYVFRLPYHNNKTKLSFIVCITIFVAIHISSLKDLIYIPAYLIPVIGLTLNYYKTDNIFISYLLHLINNLINVLLLIW